MKWKIPAGTYTSSPSSFAYLSFPECPKSSMKTRHLLPWSIKGRGATKEAPSSSRASGQSIFYEKN